MLGGADASGSDGRPALWRGVYYLATKLSRSIWKVNFFAEIAPTLWYKTAQ